LKDAVSGKLAIMIKHAAPDAPQSAEAL